MKQRKKNKNEETVFHVHNFRRKGRGEFKAEGLVFATTAKRRKETQPEEVRYVFSLCLFVS
jgi:hypothetical protein